MDPEPRDKTGTARNGPAHTQDTSHEGGWNTADEDTGTIVTSKTRTSTHTELYGHREQKTPVQEFQEFQEFQKSLALDFNQSKVGHVMKTKTLPSNYTVLLFCFDK
jgi:hypothetical protein